MKHTAWYVAGHEGHIKVLEKLWEYAKEKLTKEKLNNKLLLAEDNREENIWHYKSLRGNVELLGRLWKQAKE